MSEQTQNNNTLVIGLVVVAVLLAAIVGVLVWQSNASKPQPAAQAPATEAPQGGAPQGMGGAPQGMGGAAPATPAEVDPKSATKVPEGTEPEAFVKGYYAACDKGDWKSAFDALPADKKAGNSPEALEQQVSGYGVKSFEITGAQVQGDQATVTVDQVTGSYGTFENTWVFVKKDGQWFVASKAVTGMK